MTISQEQQAFEQQLDSLLKEHPGEYVLFKNGVPAGFFRDQPKAYAAGLQRFGIQGEFLIAPVRKQSPVSVSLAWEAGVMFGQP